MLKTLSTIFGIASALSVFIVFVNRHVLNAKPLWLSVFWAGLIAGMLYAASIGLDRLAIEDE